MQRRMTSRRIMALMLLCAMLMCSMNQRSDTAMDRPQPNTRTVKKGFQMVGDSTISLRLTISRNAA